MVAVSPQPVELAQRLLKGGHGGTRHGRHARSRSRRPHQRRRSRRCGIVHLAPLYFLAQLQHKRQRQLSGRRQEVGSGRLQSLDLFSSGVL